MKKNICIILIFISSILGCSEEREWLSTSFPLYKECDETLEKVSTFLGRSNTDYDFELVKENFESIPSYGFVPYGIAYFRVRGNLDLKSGTPKEYLQMHINSMFSECMPNNSVPLSKIDADTLERSDKIIQVYFENGVYWALQNDGSYKYTF